MVQINSVYRNEEDEERVDGGSKGLSEKAIELTIYTHAQYAAQHLHD
eukprot:CAMPEP_0172558296 /NCGR_PEP_ID=MMETSP1067-20121228/78427_1 /TAXON_ID=265564 ORGANISM="Thalassiosira punctigera, Strain Tpunct2005C2" /NCGR_SAMPLE_ID=MMETSP1067 /ASSEMBLY_ACC=CAM_ASM_000444 /LENGTH=46 /DNA_ID= /DNA_START= /DNA_END= /DNA_ORIENTATION=